MVLIRSAMALGWIMYGTLPLHNHCLPNHRYVDILKWMTTAASINTISLPTDSNRPALDRLMPIIRHKGVPYIVLL